MHEKQRYCEHQLFMAAFRSGCLLKETYLKNEAEGVHKCLHDVKWALQLIPSDYLCSRVGALLVVMAVVSCTAILSFKTVWFFDEPRE
jgi:hypothetical protein